MSVYIAVNKIKTILINELAGMSIFDQKLIDQKMIDGIQSKFFGTNVMTAPAIAKLALKFKCSIEDLHVINF